MEGDENSASDQRNFAQVLFGLQKAGARTLVGAHHAPKNLSNANQLTLENFLRGSGDIGAMCATCWGVFQTDAKKNELVLKNVKPRDFDPVEEFRIQGRPFLDDKGYFQIINMPGERDPLNPQQERNGNGKVGRPEDPQKAVKFAEAEKRIAAGGTITAVAEELEIPRRTLTRWLSEKGQVSH
jgi:hypothetical protein